MTKLFTLNPKATTVVELYGVLDPITRDWTDGLLSNIFREINKPTEKNERKYILFDGDVDTLWVESMNSVMDDNKLLTLANGERIRLQKHCALLVEVGHHPLYWNHPSDYGKDCTGIQYCTLIALLPMCTYKYTLALLFSVHFNSSIQCLTHKYCP